MLMLGLHDSIRCYLLATQLLPSKWINERANKRWKPRKTHTQSEQKDIENVEKQFHNQIKCKSTKLNTKKSNMKNILLRHPTFRTFRICTANHSHSDRNIWLGAALRVCMTASYEPWTLLPSYHNCNQISSQIFVSSFKSPFVYSFVSVFIFGYLCYDNTHVSFVNVESIVYQKRNRERTRKKKITNNGSATRSSYWMNWNGFCCWCLFFWCIECKCSWVLRVHKRITLNIVRMCAWACGDDDDDDNGHWIITFKGKSCQSNTITNEYASKNLIWKRTI